MRQNAKRTVPKPCAENELHENHRRKPDAQRPKLGAACVIERRKIALPPITGEHREADERDEKYLRDCGMNRGHQGGVTKQHASSSEKRLCHNQRESNPSPAA